MPIKMRQKLNGSVTVTQWYYDSAIETNGGKSEMIKVKHSDDER